MPHSLNQNKIQKPKDNREDFHFYSLSESKSETHRLLLNETSTLKNLLSCPNYAGTISALASPGVFLSMTTFPEQLPSSPSIQGLEFPGCSIRKCDISCLRESTARWKEEQFCC